MSGEPENRGEIEVSIMVMQTPRDRGPWILNRGLDDRVTVGFPDGGPPGVEFGVLTRECR